MNASRRWTYHFVSCLECVKCRAKTKLRLFNKRGDLLDDIQNCTLEVIQANVEDYEVWCLSCAPEGSYPMSRITLSEGRKQHKREAAQLATLRAASQIASRYDLYTLPDGRQETKQELVRKALDKPCNVCYHEPATKLFRNTNVAAMASGAYTHAEITRAIRESVPCCASCFTELKQKRISMETFREQGIIV